MFSSLVWLSICVSLATPAFGETGASSSTPGAVAGLPALADSGATPRAKLVLYALQTHPSLAAAHLQTQAARREPADGLTPLQLEAGAAPLSFGEHELGVEVGARWAIPALGMRKLQGEQLGWAAEADFAQERMVMFEVAARASIALDRYLAARANLAALTRYAEGFASLEAAIERRLAAGLATPSAKVMAQMEAAKAEAAVLVGRRALLQAEAEVRAAIGETELAAIPDEIGPVLIGQQAGIPAGTPTEERPAVKMAQVDAAMADTMARMAARSGRPMVELMGEYSTMWADPMHRLMVGTMVSIPLDTRVRALRSSAAMDRQLVATRRVEAEQREADLAVAEARAMLDEAAAMARLAQDRMLPLATEAARLARANWEGGSGSLVDYLRAEQERVQAESMVATSLAEQRQSEAMFAMATGQFAGLPAFEVKE